MTKSVHISTETEFGITRRLTEGQDVHVIGWDFGYDEIDATRIAVYNTDLPVRWVPGR